VTDSSSPIVTPEAVVLDFETAGVGSRCIAKLLDVLVQLAALLAVLMAVGIVAGAAGGGEAAAIVLIAVASFLVLFGYPVLSETIWNGKTLGKTAMGLRAVTREGAPIRFRHAAVRGIIGFVEVYVLSFIAVIAAMLSRNNQRVGDLAGGTIVIRERTATAHAVALSFFVPPGYEKYAQSLDVSGIDARQYQVIRSFLTRVLQLSPEARMAMSLRLANPVAVELDHQPPAGVGPELFLVCVAAAYQQRHGGGAANGWSSQPWAPAYGATAWSGPGGAAPVGWAPPTAGGYGWGPDGRPPYADAPVGAPPPPPGYAVPAGAPPPPPPGYAVPAPAGWAPESPTWPQQASDPAASGFDPPR
jgi:uncharacterized RDD family membrane protein YckC